MSAHAFAIPTFRLSTKFHNAMRLMMKCLMENVEVSSKFVVPENRKAKVNIENTFKKLQAESIHKFSTFKEPPFIESKRFYINSNRSDHTYLNETNKKINSIIDNHLGDFKKTNKEGNKLINKVILAPNLCYTKKSALHSIIEKKPKVMKIFYEILPRLHHNFLFEIDAKHIKDGQYSKASDNSKKDQKFIVSEKYYKNLTDMHYKLSNNFNAKKRGKDNTARVIKKNEKRLNRLPFVPLTKQRNEHTDDFKHYTALKKFVTSDEHKTPFEQKWSTQKRPVFSKHPEVNIPIISPLDLMKVGKLVKPQTLTLTKVDNIIQIADAIKQVQPQETLDEKNLVSDGTIEDKEILNEQSNYAYKMDGENTLIVTNSEHVEVNIITLDEKNQVQNDIVEDKYILNEQSTHENEMDVKNKSLVSNLDHAEVNFISLDNKSQVQNDIIEDTHTLNEQNIYENKMNVKRKSVCANPDHVEVNYLCSDEKNQVQNDIIEEKHILNEQSTYENEMDVKNKSLVPNLDHAEVNFISLDKKNQVQNDIVEDTHTLNEKNIYENNMNVKYKSVVENPDYIEVNFLCLDEKNQVQNDILEGRHILNVQSIYENKMDMKNKSVVPNSDNVEANFIALDKKNQVQNDIVKDKQILNKQSNYENKMDVRNKSVISNFDNVINFMSSVDDKCLENSDIYKKSTYDNKVNMEDISMVPNSEHVVNLTPCADDKCLKKSDKNNPVNCIKRSIHLQLKSLNESDIKEDAKNITNETVKIQNELKYFVDYRNLTLKNLLKAVEQGPTFKEKWYAQKRKVFKKRVENTSMPYISPLNLMEVKKITKVQTPQLSKTRIEHLTQIMNDVKRIELQNILNEKYLIQYYMDQDIDILNEQRAYENKMNVKNKSVFSNSDCINNFASSVDELCIENSDLSRKPSVIFSKGINGKHHTYPLIKNSHHKAHNKNNNVIKAPGKKYKNDYKYKMDNEDNNHLDVNKICISLPIKRKDEESDNLNLLDF